MQRDPTTAILAACGRACLDARDGRGRRFPVARCTEALTATGSSPAVSQACALAMARVAQSVQALAARQPAA